MAEAIYYEVCRGSKIFPSITIVDIITEEAFKDTKHNNNYFVIPRTAFELTFLAKYAECRVNDSEPTETWKNWEEIDQSQESQKGKLLWIAPPLYYDHLRHKTTFEDAVLQYESSKGFKRLRWRLNNLIVSQLLKANIVL